MSEQRDEPQLGQVTNHTSRERRELEVIKSDRVELLEQANKLVDTLSQKDIVASISSVPSALDWTEEERIAYNSALTFLGKQFNQGYKDSEVIERAKENEYHTLYKPREESDA